MYPNEYISYVIIKYQKQSSFEKIKKHIKYKV